MEPALLELSPRARSLLEQRVDSLQKLEIVAALWGAPRRSMSVGELGERTHLPVEIIRTTADELRTSGLLDLGLDEILRLAPPSRVDEEVLGEVVGAYRKDPFQIVKLLLDLALRRIRSLTLLYGGSISSKEPGA